MDRKNISKLLLPEIEKLLTENKLLGKQLREAKESIDAIKAGSIDAVVIANEKGLKVYTENTADKIYRILIEKMHEGAVTLDQEGTIIYCNSYFADLLALPLQKVIGAKFIDLIDEPSKKRFENLLKNEKPTLLREEIYLHTGNAEKVPMLMSANTFSLDDTFLVSIILTDLTAQTDSREQLSLKTKQLEQKNAELEIANNDLTSFTYISSHDLQEPLRKIQNFVACIFIEDEKNLSAPGKEYFHRLEQTTKRMQALIEDLLLYSRTKNTNEKFQKTNLQIIIAEVEKDLEHIIGEKAAKIEVGDCCEMNIIRFQFRQLFYNLISNSLKFTKEGIAPHIKIKSSIVKMDMPNSLTEFTKIKYCHITYTDNGIGFDPQYSTRIFDVFQRLHSQEEYKGNGMGLAICKRVVENHHGIITATGKLHMGAEFDIYIPTM